MGKTKKMRVTITIRQTDKAKFSREFQACARLLKSGLGSGHGTHGARQGASCFKARSPREAVRGALRLAADRLGRTYRPGHKRYGRR